MRRHPTDPAACLHCGLVDHTRSWRRDGVDDLGRTWYATTCTACQRVTRKPAMPLSLAYPLFVVR